MSHRMQKTIPMKLFIGLAVLFATTALISGAAAAHSQLYCQTNIPDCTGFLVLASFENPIHQEDYAESTSTIDAAPYTALGVEISPDSASGQQRGKTGTQGIGTFEITTEIPDGAAMVAYGEVIDDEGVPYTIAGIAGGPDDVESVRAWAIDKYQEIVSGSEPLPAFTTDGCGECWPIVKSSNTYIEKKPVGRVSQNSAIYKLTCDQDRSRDYVGIKQSVMMYPGFSVWPYESKYMNENGYCSMDYSVNTISNSVLFDWDPFGTKTGPASVSISLSPAPALTWSFSLDDWKIKDNNNPSTNTARWDWTCRGESKSVNTGFEPGSTVSFSPSTKGTYTFAKLRASGTFKYQVSWWQSVEKTLGLTQYVTYTVR